MRAADLAIIPRSIPLPSSLTQLISSAGNFSRRNRCGGHWCEGKIVGNEIGLGHGLMGESVAAAEVEDSVRADLAGE